MEDACGQLNAHVVPADEKPLLQLADIVAYVCSHSLGESADAQFWKQQCARISNRYKVGWQA
jgi:predicted N-acyltransferase